jgi:acyl transferase domain-containing protein
MLQINDIQHRGHLLEQAIGLAAQACSSEHNIPRELRDSIQRLDRHADTARAVLLSQDAPRIDKMVAEMERLAEKARQVCINVPYLSPQMKTAVTQMHGQIQELKRDTQRRQT